MTCILVFNSGSSSLKFSVFQKEGMELLLNGEVESLFDDPTIWIEEKGERKEIHKKFSPGISNVLPFVLDEVNQAGKGEEISVISHRVVHGGKTFKGPTLVTPEVIKKLKEFIPLAPLHQPFNIDTIEETMKFYPHIPQVACFDTSFHRTQPLLAELFPLPLELAEKDGIIRYGFHGLSYQYIASQLPKYVGEKAHKKVIVGHLGSGASLCAMQNLKSIGTSMGFTALDGLMMGTRPGNLDTGIILYLLDEKGYSSKEISDLLYKKSGLQGISGMAHDMRTLTESDSKNAQLAVDLFCYIAAKQISSLIPPLNGLDVLVFTAGIGENSPVVRQKICDSLQWLGLEIDPDHNEKNAEKISTDKSKIDVYVIPTNEELIMAQNAVQLIS